MTYRFWTNKEIDFLTINSESIPLANIAEILRRPIESIRKKAKKLGLQTTSHRKPIAWTAEHTALFSTATNTEIAAKTGRTYNAVWQKKKQLRQKLAA
jgi:hypothetical protein